MLLISMIIVAVGTIIKGRYIFYDTFFVRKKLQKSRIDFLDSI